MQSILGLILLLTLSTASAEVYRWTDDKGVIHYGDKPLAADARPVELPPLQTYSPGSVAAPGGTGREVAAPSIRDDKPPAIRITSPSPEETIRDGEQKFSVTVDVTLRPGQGLLYFLDGTQQNKTATVSTAWLMENVERGEHQVSASVVAADGKLLSRSEPVTVHMKPPIAQPAPKPRPAGR